MVDMSTSGATLLNSSVDTKQDSSYHHELVSSLKNEDDIVVTATDESPLAVSQLTENISDIIEQQRGIRTTAEQFIRQQALLEAKFALYKRQLAEERRQRRVNAERGEGRRGSAFKHQAHCAPQDQWYEDVQPSDTGRMEYNKSTRCHYDAEEIRIMTQTRLRELARERIIRQQRNEESLSLHPHTVDTPPLLTDVEDWYIYHCFFPHDPLPSRFLIGTQAEQIVRRRLDERAFQFAALREFILQSASMTTTTLPQQSRTLLFLTEHEPDLMECVRQLETNDLLTYGDWSRVRIAMVLRKLWWAMTQPTCDFEGKRRDLHGLINSVYDIVRECKRCRQDQLARELKEQLAVLQFYSVAQPTTTPASTVAGDSSCNAVLSVLAPPH